MVQAGCVSPHRRSVAKISRLLRSIGRVATVAFLSADLMAASGNANGIGVEIPSTTVPPGAMLQLVITMTEPKPILKGGQAASFSPSVLGTPQGIHLYSPAGDASGVAVLGAGNVHFFFNSPLASLGTGNDSPVITMTLPVSSRATVGQQFALALDTTSANWIDPSSQPYPIEFKSGVLTIGGALSVSDVNPGAGKVLAGQVISISGTGFQPNSSVDVNGATVATTKYVGPNLLQITLAGDTNLEGRRVRVRNRNPNERVAYYPYQKTTAMGTSSHLLLAASYPLFSWKGWTAAYFKPLLAGTSFSGLALQNSSTSSVAVSLELHSNTGALLDTQLVAVAANSRIVRDLREFFPSVTPASGTEVKITSAVPVQALALVGDDATGIVLPVELSPTP